MPAVLTEVVPDDAALRQERRARVLAEMAADGVDVLVLGREANARYVAGAPRLWIAGSRPFGAGCVLVRETAAIHLLSTWDEGIPDDIPREHLYGISFNPANALAALQGIEGATTARTVATDGLSPGFTQMLPRAFPAAELVDGEPLLRRARTVKTPLEVDALRQSVGVAERALAAATEALEVGVTERQLTGAFMAAMASEGVTIPSTQDVAWITSHGEPWGRASRDAPVQAGDLVAFDAGVLVRGYLGELGRTRSVGPEAAPARAVLDRGRRLLDGLLTACRPGAPLTDLLGVYEAAGEPLPPMPVARGLGLGFDLPLVTPALRQTAEGQPIEEGMVLALTAHVGDREVGGAYLQEPVVVTGSGPESLCEDPA